jgi:hypothetical protein
MAVEYLRKGFNLTISFKYHLSGVWVHNYLYYVYRMELHRYIREQESLHRNILKRMRWVGHVAGITEVRIAERSLSGRPERKRPLGKLNLR